MIRRALALIILCVGLYLFHSASFYHGILAARGVGDWASLSGDAPFLLRFAGAGLLVFGGAFALRSGRTGTLVTLMGTLCFVLLTVAMIVMGADRSLWQDEAIWALALILLSAGLFAFRRA